MRAMVLTGIRSMEMRDVPDLAPPGPGEVKIRMKAVGVCGSDIHYYTTGRIGSQVVNYPFAVGHECAGEIVETGPGVDSLKRGDLVAIDPAMPCGECDQCRSRRQNTCRKNRFLGCPGQAEGSLSEHLIMPAECCYPLRSGAPAELGTISEPLAIGVYAVKQSVPMKGVRIGILGFGPIGMCVLLAAKAYGAERIYVTDKIDARLAMAEKAGAAWTGNPLGQDIVEEVEREEPLLLDAVFECCGQQEALDQAVDLLKPGGKLMFIGIPETDRVSFQPDKIRRKEICIQNVRRQAGCVQEALDLIDSGRIDAARMITHRFPFEKTKEAFDLVTEYRGGVMKAMITFD